MIDEALIADLQAKLTRTADWEYFFNKLESPEWAKPLFDAGLFGEPYAPIQEGSTFQLPGWPPSMYLARVAKQEPDVIGSIVVRIPETENTRIHRDLMQALVPATSDQILSMLPSVKRWLHSRFLSLILLEPGAQLVVTLAERGFVDQALDLLEDWLSPAGDVDGDGIVWQPSDWEFGEALDRTVPELASQNPKATLRILVRILADLQRSELNRDPSDNASDFSTTWRPAIEESTQNHLDFERSRLLVHVRDTARLAAAADCRNLTDTIGILKEGRWRVFDRLSLNVAREVGASCPELIGQLLLDESTFDNFDVYHEWITLAHDLLNDLNDQDKSQFVSRLFAGPDVEQFRIRHTEHYNEAPPEELVLEYVDQWRARRLSMIRESLSPERLEEAEQIFSRVPEDLHPDFLSWSTGVMTGPTSPLTPGQISDLSNDDLMLFLDTWEPESGFMLPTYEGLGRALTEASKAEPSRFLSIAERFIGRRPNFVRAAVFDAMRTLVADPSGPHPSSGEWIGLLDLAEWVIQQDIGSAAEDHFDHEVSWVNSRKTIAHAIDTAISTKRLPVELGDRAWEIIATLLNDPQPTIEHERQLLETMDPGMIAINTVRGTAMHAAFNFLQWSERTETTESSEAVLTAVAAHLATDQDPSLAVRSVFGWVFPAVRSRFPEWAIAHVDRVFPLELPARSFLDASWDVYLARWRPGPDELGLLRDRYDLAVDRLGGAGGDQHRVGSLSTRDQLLVEHLVWLYAMGSIPLDDELLTRFLSVASVELKTHATAYLGRMFLNNPPPNADIRERLRRWWNSRTAQGVLDEDLSELGTLGWWTWAANTDPQWYLEEMKNILRSGVQLDGGHFYVAALADLASDWPSQSLACIKLIEAQGHQPWLFFGHNEEIVRILRAALAADSTTAAAARSFIDLLAAKGSGDFGNLLVDE